MMNQLTHRTTKAKTETKMEAQLEEVDALREKPPGKKTAMP
jgi:hypothetical protein